MLNNDNIDDRRDEQSDRSNEEFPGYPHYPSNEDITHPKIGVQKVDSDLDDMSRSNLSAVPGRDAGTGTEPLRTSDTSVEDDEDLKIVPGTEADVTPEDLQMLGPRDGDMDLGDDEILHGKMSPVNLADDELDIPGAELDDDSESIGEEDEENNYYSLGGDRHENLDEDNQQEPEVDNE